MTDTEKLAEATERLDAAERQIQTLLEVVAATAFVVDKMISAPVYENSYDTLPQRDRDHIDRLKRAASELTEAAF